MILKRVFSLGVVFFMVFSFFSLAHAALSISDLPDLLKPWISWVLHHEEKKLCSFFQGDPEKKSCQWPGKLALVFTQSGGTFEQTWEVEQRGWVKLPGGLKIWPQNVKTGEASLVVLEHDNTPSLYLEKGTYHFIGEFVWDPLPDSFPIPLETGLVELSLNGTSIDFPQRDDQGHLWLGKAQEVTTDETDLVEIQVFRKVEDEVPLFVTTQIDLKISGKNREVLLGKTLLEGFIPLSLSSVLPARLESTGHLKIQVRPGQWSLVITSHSKQNIMALKRPDPQGLWVEEEIWVFQPQPSLRLVDVNGVAPVDPRQTNVPSPWQNLSTYRMLPTDTFELTQKQRGNENPPPDELSLERTLWLDFNGKGLTLHDQLNGLIRQTSRLEMEVPFELGHVQLDGEDQLITQLPNSQSRGIEIRHGQLNVEADSRLPRRSNRFPVAGWNHDFSHVQTTLHLPPGWRLFASPGVDHVSTSWVTNWTLLDFFMVMMTVVAVAKLWDLRWGIIAFLTLGLTYHEVLAPRWIWLYVIAGEALCRYLPEGKFKSFFRTYRFGTRVFLLAFTIPFLIAHVRGGLHPMLGDAATGYPKAPQTQEEKMIAPSPNMPPEPALEGMVEQKIEDMVSSLKLRKKIFSHDPQALVQTGPGLTNWTWHPVDLNWHGSVQKKAAIQLWLIPPWLNLWLSLARALLISLLVARLLGYAPRFFFDFWKKKSVVLMIALFLIIGNFSIARADAHLPSLEMLAELKERLLEKPTCFPNCGSISRMAVETQSTELRLRLEAHAAIRTAIALPGSQKDWSPSTVLVNDEPAKGLIRHENGLLYLLLEEGTHTILMAGPLPSQESLQLSLPLRPHQVKIISENGWTLSGLGPHGIPSDNLTLSRQATEGVSPSMEAPQIQSTQNLPPFVRVTRTLFFDLDWQVQTRVIRLSPVGTAIHLEIPLLPGESVTSADSLVHDGKMSINLGAQITETSWQSTLAHQPSLLLSSPETTSWVETWRLEASPIWHVEYQGIPPIHQADPLLAMVPQWRPWPGEAVTLKISRPQAVPGQTLTMDRSKLAITPGRRSTDNELTLDFRSSLGGQHSLGFSQGSVVKSLIIDQEDKPVRLEQNHLIFNYTPGAHSLRVQWTHEKPLSPFYQVPPLDLGIQSVNTNLEIMMPPNRWTLYLSGPLMGPAVLFWPYLFVTLLLALSLSKLPVSPLSLGQWMLLSLGLTQVPVTAALLVAGWFLFLGWRLKKPDFRNAFWFDLRQLVIIVWTLTSLSILIHAVHHGLLGDPSMQIAGNESTHLNFLWYQDRTESFLPQPWVFSLPLYTYHFVMLAWSIWIAFSMIRWIRFAWRAYNEGGIWQRLPTTEFRIKADPPAP